jgi:ParB family chromosome partitioning protein
MSESLTDPEGESHIQEIPLDQIAANPMQPRTLFDPIKLEELANSIREHGVLQPILVRRIGHDRYQLLAGERRFRAAQSCGITIIPALVKKCTEKQQLEIAIVENLQREDIGALEAARAYRRMAHEFDMTQEAIAARVGKSRAAVTNTMGLLDLPEEVQDSLETGQITEGHARALKGLKHAEAILDAWRVAVRKGLSVRDTEKLVRESRNEAGAVIVGSHTRSQPSIDNPSAIRGSDPNEAYLIDKLQEALKTKVLLRRTTGESGKIEIEFYSNEDLERIVEALVPIL